MIHKTKKCKYCNKNFKNIEGRVFSNHVRWCNKNPNYIDMKEKASINSTKSAIKNNAKRFGGLFIFKKVNCFICNKRFKIKERKLKSKERYFCNRICANKYSSSCVDRTDPIKNKLFSKKMSKISKELWMNQDYVKKQSLVNKKFNSKAEVELRNLFLNENKDWTFGGTIKFKETILARDLYSKKLKINIELDGIWHFKNIHNQLKDKRFKDKMLLKWSLENGYKLIRVSEDFYWKNKLEILTIIKKIIKDKNNKIFLLGDEFKKINMYKKYII